MEVELSGGSLLGRGSRWVKNSPKMLWDRAVGFAETIKKVGKDDPRRMIHPLKEGLALTLVSLVYYLKPLYHNFGSNAMCAVLTVILIFEFSVGATLAKGLNRLLATIVGGALAFGIHHLASLTGETAEPILLGFFVFTIAAMGTYVRFIPEMKVKYDYGVLIFMLTFSLVSISGYRNDEMLKFAHQRLSTIVIGCVVAVVVCITICPVWVGQDLHNLVALNIDKLADFLQGFESEYFEKPEEDGTKSKSKKAFLEGYKSVLTSKNCEETMANLASWEPAHGRFRFRHPWKQYLKVGTLTRQCSYKIEALNNYLKSPMQTPEELRLKIRNPCTKICLEASKALKQVASMLRTMTMFSSPTISHIENSKTAAEKLKSLLKMSLWKEADLLEIVQLVAIATLLIDIVTCVEEILKAANELSHLAKFKNPEADQVVAPTLVSRLVLHQGTVQPISSVHGTSDEHEREHKHEYVVAIDEPSLRVIRGNAGGSSEIESENGNEVTLHQLMELHSK